MSAVALGGAVGALARVATAEAWPTAAGEWPWATFTVNMVGTLILATVWRWAQTHPAGPDRKRWYAAGPGLAGALTTFSTVQVEVVRIAQGGRSLLALGYALASIAGGLAIVAAVTRWRRH